MKVSNAKIADRLNDIRLPHIGGQIMANLMQQFMDGEVLLLVWHHKVRKGKGKRQRCDLSFNPPLPRRFWRKYGV